MLYRLLRAIVAFALRLFYRLEVVSKVTDLSGPVMFVGNHPNSLIDPALVFVITARQVTFLARDGLFAVPVLGWVLRGIGALPVYRKQDHQGQTERNEGTLLAAAQALSSGQAITIFPEGKSHSAPQLADVKTGAARIALRVARQGQALRIIPVGLTYAQKHRFRSRVHVEVGEPLLVQAAPAALDGDAEQAWVRELTGRVEAGLREVTLNLETWEDLELIETADRLLQLRQGYREQDPERLRVLAKAAAVLRNQDPERFDELKDDVLSYRRRLKMIHADPGDLQVHYDRLEVVKFTLRNLAALVFGFPLFAVGLALFAPPFLLLRTVVVVAPLSRDRVATLKFVATLVLVPAWWAVLTGVALWLGGPRVAGAAFVAAPSLALFTRYFLEWRSAAVEDVITFLRLGNRSRLRQHLLFEGERLQDELARLSTELLPRLR